MYESAICFDEKEEVERLNINYHQIASHTAKPKEENVNKFLDLVNSIKNKGGKIHIHCYAGADRTGMYAFIYKAMNNLGNLIENEREWKKSVINREYANYSICGLDCTDTDRGCTGHWAKWNKCRICII